MKQSEILMYLALALVISCAVLVLLSLNIGDTEISKISCYDRFHNEIENVTCISEDYYLFGINSDIYEAISAISLLVFFVLFIKRLLE